MLFRSERHQIQKAFSLFIPDNVVNTLAQQRKIEALGTYGELLQGVCMATDASQYTALGENLTPMELNVLMNSYYGIMFPLVKNFDGIISDVMGDAMLAVWAKPTAEKQLRINACEAALAIKIAIDKFNLTQPHHLHTRIGLHYGEMRLGNVGAADHFEYRAVGDIVNTATRIESMNKLLGTQILVSQNVIADIPDFYTRDVGVFILKGKTQPVSIVELINHTDAISPSWTALTVRFSEALQAYQHYQWQTALQLFTALQHDYPHDGPTQFYLNYLRQHLHRLSASERQETPAWIDVGSNLAIH